MFSGTKCWEIACDINCSWTEINWLTRSGVYICVLRMDCYTVRAHIVGCGSRPEPTLFVREFRRKDSSMAPVSILRDAVNGNYLTLRIGWFLVGGEKQQADGWFRYLPDLAMRTHSDGTFVAYRL